MKTAYEIKCICEHNFLAVQQKRLTIEEFKKFVLQKCDEMPTNLKKIPTKAIVSSKESQAFANDVFEEWLISHKSRSGLYDPNEYSFRKN